MASVLDWQRNFGNRFQVKKNISYQSRKRNISKTQRRTINEINRGTIDFFIKSSINEEIQVIEPVMGISKLEFKKTIDLWRKRNYV